jgi:hypothetical protein
MANKKCLKLNYTASQKLLPAPSEHEKRKRDERNVFLFCVSTGRKKGTTPAWHRGPLVLRNQKNGVPDPLAGLGPHGGYKTWVGVRAKKCAFPDPNP